MNNFNQFWKDNNQNTQNQQAQQQANSQQTGFNTQNQPVNNQEQPSWMMEMAGACLPILMKKFTGLDMPPVGGNTMETQIVLSQVLTLQQQIITGQQDLTRQIANLETRASQQFNGLVKQVQNLSSVRLTHEKKQIDFSSRSENESNRY